MCQSLEMTERVEPEVCLQANCNCVAQHTKAAQAASILSLQL